VSENKRQREIERGRERDRERRRRERETETEREEGRVCAHLDSCRRIALLSFSASLNHAITSLQPTALGRPQQTNAALNASPRELPAHHAVLLLCSFQTLHHLFAAHSVLVADVLDLDLRVHKDADSESERVECHTCDVPHIFRCGFGVDVPPCCPRRARMCSIST
jgi:hypothetical protein